MWSTCEHWWVAFREMTKHYTHLSSIELWVAGVVCEEEHVYEVDEYTGSYFGLVGSVDNPLEDDHKHQVSKQTQHEEQLRDQHEEHTAYLAKVPEKSQTKGEGRRGIYIRINMKRKKELRRRWTWAYFLHKKIVAYK